MLISRLLPTHHQTIGLTTFEWIETTSDEMNKAMLFAPPNAPGLRAVSCGLLTYCIDAAGAHAAVQAAFTSPS
jgi:hypothetical protein